MADSVHEWTDERIADMATKFHEAYAEAANTMQDRLEETLANFARQNLEWQDRVAKGTTTESNYKQWLQREATNIEWMGDMIDRLASDAVNADELAMAAINDELPSVYAENANYMAYDIDTRLGRDTRFTLYDTQTVRNLLIGNPDLYPSASVDTPKDLLWNKRKLTDAITQGILTGDSIPKIADRLVAVLDMDERVAVRAARTATTAAENLGRVSSMKRAVGMGIKVEQLWIATIDTRTRITHRELDMQHVPVGKKFKTSSGVELACPGDPGCEEPSEVYNCRCSLGAWMPQVDYENMERWSRLPEGMTFEDWKAGKKPKEAKRGAK